MCTFYLGNVEGQLNSKQLPNGLRSTVLYLSVMADCLSQWVGWEDARKTRKTPSQIEPWGIICLDLLKQVFHCLQVQIEHGTSLFRKMWFFLLQVSKSKKQGFQWSFWRPQTFLKIEHPWTFWNWPSFEYTWLSPWFEFRNAWCKGLRRTST